LKENSKWHVMLLFLLDKNVQRSSNVFHPLYDMDLETTLVDEFSSIEQNHQDKLQSKSISSSDIIDLNPRVSIVENELSIL
jgi:hypothetical protein